jgi:hypothetical protein
MSSALYAGLQIFVHTKQSSAKIRELYPTHIMYNARALKHHWEYLNKATKGGKL